MSSTVTVQGETYGQELKTLLFAVEFLHSPRPRGVDSAHFCSYIHVGGYILRTFLHIYGYGARRGREYITSGISFKVRIYEALPYNHTRYSAMVVLIFNNLPHLGVRDISTAGASTCLPGRGRPGGHLITGLQHLAPGRLGLCAQRSLQIPDGQQMVSRGHLFYLLQSPVCSRNTGRSLVLSYYILYYIVFYYIILY